MASIKARTNKIMKFNTQNLKKISKFKTQPLKHQIACLNQYGRRKFFALLAEQGTGKTWIIINNVADLWASDECDAMLVLAPSGVQLNWTRIEIIKHMPDWVQYKALTYNPAKTKKAEAEFEALFSTDRSLRILAMNWESIQTERGFKVAKYFCNTSRKLMIVADESDSIKNPKAQRTKALMKLKPYSEYRRILTGTPINNAPFDAFTQFSFLDEYILGTNSFPAFKAEYAEMLQDDNPLLIAIRRKIGSWYTPQVVAKDFAGKPKYKNLGKLASIIDQHSFRVLKKDCLDLPNKVYKTLLFNLTSEQRKVYYTAEKHCRFIFGSGETPFIKLVAITKLAQITSGYYIPNKGEKPIRILGKNPKLDLLAEQVEKIVAEGNKIIIWARYQVEIDDIVARLSAYNVVQYHGRIKKGDRPAVIDAFEHGDANVLVGNQQAGGRGLTLIAASYVMYFSNSFSLRDRIQSEDRAHRIGQTRTVTYLNIAAQGTIDEVVIASLEGKKDLAEVILDRGLTLFDYPK